MKEMKEEVEGERCWSENQKLKVRISKFGMWKMGVTCKTKGVPKRYRAVGGVGVSFFRTVSVDDS